MSEKKKKKRKTVKHEDAQTEEIKGLLDDMEGDAAPYLSSDKARVKTPSFLKAKKRKRTSSAPSEAKQKSVEPSAETDQATSVDKSSAESLQAPGGARPAPPQPKANEVIEPPTSVPEVEMKTFKPPESTPKKPKDEWSELIESEKPNGEFFHDLEIFFVQLGRAFSHRYDLWEETYNVLLTILKKMRDTMEENTEKMMETIQNLYEKMIKGFKDFERKQSEVERFSDLNYKQVAKQFKKTLELLNFQIREFKLQMMVDDLYNIYLD